MTTPTRVVVSVIEEVILTNLEELVEGVENEEEPFVFLQGEEVNNTLLGSGSSGCSKGKVVEEAKVKTKQ